MTFQVGDPFCSLVEGRGQCVWDTDKYMRTAYFLAVLCCQGLNHPHLFVSFILQRDEYDH